MSKKNSEVMCQICSKKKPSGETMPSELVSPSIAELIKKRHPNWTSDGFICSDELNRFRFEYISSIVETEKGELTAIDKEVLDSIEGNDLLYGASSSALVLCSA